MPTISTFLISTSPFGALCALYPRGVEVTGLGCVLDTSGLILVLRHYGQGGGDRSPLCVYLSSCHLAYFLFFSTPSLVWFSLFFCGQAPIPPTSGTRDPRGLSKRPMPTYLSFLSSYTIPCLLAIFHTFSTFSTIYSVC